MDFPRDVGARDVRQRDLDAIEPAALPEIEMIEGARADAHDNPARRGNLFNPAYRRYLLTWAKIQVDGGVDGVNFDEVNAGFSGGLKYGFNGNEGFDDYTIADFNRYLLARYPSFTAADWKTRFGMADDNLVRSDVPPGDLTRNFNYRTYLRAHGWNLDPLTGENLRRRHPRARAITVEKIDPASGERRREEKTLRPVAGFDLVFSVPKSVSLLHALGDDQTRRVVNEAHTAAWQAALAYLEDEACVVRRGTGGVHREHGDGFVAAAYQHRTSRAQEPQLHTHVIVANMASRPSDGKWRALDGEAILKTYRLAAGYLYQAHLRGALSQSLGVEWETAYKGLADLKGVAREVIDEFSTRRAQVVEHMDERGTSGFWAAQIAALDTRDRKEHVDLVRLRAPQRRRCCQLVAHNREVQRQMMTVELPAPALIHSRISKHAEIVFARAEVLLRARRPVRSGRGNQHRLAMHDTRRLQVSLGTQ